MDIKKLHDHFPKDAVSWRAQKMTKDGKKALALAYIDARDVMDRLDEVVGPENWQSAYTETATGRVICTLSIRIDEEWVSKSDGSGSTDIEAEKGGISGALKRAAVSWGIGRYLYEMPNVWAPCESYMQGGKPRWSKWIGDPWDHVRGGPVPRSEVEKTDDDLDAEAEATAQKIVASNIKLENTTTAAELDAARREVLTDWGGTPPAEVIETFKTQKAKLLEDQTA